MSLSPFDSFQSRFVTYLLNFPRTKVGKPESILCAEFQYVVKFFFYQARLLIEAQLNCKENLYLHNIRERESTYMT